MATLKVFLEALDPRLWYLATGGIVWLVLWAWRRWLPALWVAMTAKGPAISQLPIALIGALLNAGPALFAPTFGKIIQDTIVGAIMSMLSAQGFHAMLKALPGKYDGAETRVNAARAARAATQATSERPTPPGVHPAV